MQSRQKWGKRVYAQPPNSPGSPTLISRLWNTWRWAHFDRTLTFGRKDFVGDLAAGSISADDFVICGAPRTGTTFLCAALFQPPRVLTVMQPWNGLRVSPGDLFRELRDEIDRTKTVNVGRLDLERLATRREISVVAEGSRAFPVETRERYLLGVKWPVFYRYLQHLPDVKFLVCVRDPVDTIRSYELSTANPGLRALAQGYGNRNGLNAEMNRHLKRVTDDPSVRRVELFDYHYERIIPHLDSPNVYLVRHERWFTEPARLLTEIGEFLGVALTLDRIPRIKRSQFASYANSDAARLVRARCRTGPLLGYG